MEMIDMIQADGKGGGREGKGMGRKGKEGDVWVMGVIISTNVQVSCSCSFSDKQTSSRYLPSTYGPMVVCGGSEGR